MKILILSVGFLCLLSCSKTETQKDSSQNLEETIKFTTNLDTGIYNVADTLPLVVNVSSKIPTAGFLYSISVTSKSNATNTSNKIRLLVSQTNYQENGIKEV